MLLLNFYKIRTGLNITPKKQGGDEESNLRYEQLLQTIGQKGDIEYLSPIYEIEEKFPKDMGAYTDNQITIQVLIFGIDKTRSAWTAADLTQSFGNMVLTARIKEVNPEAEEWIGGALNNISCEAAYFDLKTKKNK